MPGGRQDVYCTEQGLSGVEMLNCSHSIIQDELIAGQGGKGKSNVPHGLSWWEVGLSQEDHVRETCTE